MASPKHSSGSAIFKRLLREHAGFRWHFAGIFALGALAAPLALVTPLAMKIAADNYIGDQPLPDYLPQMDPLVLSVVLVLGVAALKQGLNFTKQVLRVYTKERLVLGFRMRLFPHVERLSLSYHDQKGPSDSTFRVLFDTAVIPSVLIDGMIPAVQSLVLLIVVATAVVVVSWKLALVALAIAPLMLLISWPFGQSLRRQWHDIKELDTAAMSVLQEVFSAVRVVKAFGKEQQETDRLTDLAKQGMWAKVRVAKTQGQFDALTTLFAAIGTAAFLYIGAMQVKSGALTVGELILVAALLVQLYSPLQFVVGQIASMQSALASAERALELLDEAPEVVERPHARALARANGAVAFDNVSFGYEPNQTVIKGVSFDVEPGMRIGIAGATGAGKTTLMSLLTRLYDPGDGAIRLDGTDIRDLKVDDLRRQFSIVLQEPVLFKKSIAENINYALPNSTREATIEAAKLANAHDFILAMPDGYDTIVGERGMRLSGGERQRISLARAFLKDAPILILDEPTSSVDIETEAQILSALERLMQGRTTFIIAHRPNTLETCDKVLVLDKGRLAKFASPESASSLVEMMMTKATRAPGA